MLCSKRPIAINPSIFFHLTEYTVYEEHNPDEKPEFEFGVSYRDSEYVLTMTAEE